MDDLYYIELEHGCAVKRAFDEDHAWEIAEAHAREMETEVIEVRLATEEDQEWIRSMHGFIA